MIELKVVFFLIIVHFLADFCLQTHEQAINKSSSNKYLFYHVGTYSLAWFFAMWGFCGIWQMAFMFATMTFSLHFATDYVTSRISKKFFEAKDFHNGFVVVGFDQVLHYFQLLVTFVFLNGIKW